MALGSFRGRAYSKSIINSCPESFFKLCFINWVSRSVACGRAALLLDKRKVGVAKYACDLAVYDMEKCRHPSRIIEFAVAQENCY